MIGFRAARYFVGVLTVAYFPSSFAKRSYLTPSCRDDLASLSQPQNLDFESDDASPLQKSSPELQAITIRRLEDVQPFLEPSLYNKLVAMNDPGLPARLQLNVQKLRHGDIGGYEEAAEELNLFTLRHQAGFGRPMEADKVELLAALSIREKNREEFFLRSESLDPKAFQSAFERRLASSNPLTRLKAVISLGGKDLWQLSGARNALITNREESLLLLKEVVKNESEVEIRYSAAVALRQHPRFKVWEQLPDPDNVALVRAIKMYSSESARPLVLTDSGNRRLNDASVLEAIKKSFGNENAYTSFPPLDSARSHEMGQTFKDMILYGRSSETLRDIFFATEHPEVRSLVLSALQNRHDSAALNVADVILKNPDNYTLESVTEAYHIAAKAIFANSAQENSSLNRKILRDFARLSMSKPKYRIFSQNAFLHVKVEGESTLVPQGLLEDLRQHSYRPLGVELAKQAKLSNPDQVAKILDSVDDPAIRAQVVFSVADRVGNPDILKALHDSFQKERVAEVKMAILDVLDRVPHLMADEVFNQALVGDQPEKVFWHAQKLIVANDDRHLFVQDDVHQGVKERKTPWSKAYVMQKLADNYLQKIQEVSNKSKTDPENVSLWEREMHRDAINAMVAAYQVPDPISLDLNGALGPLKNAEDFVRRQVEFNNTAAPVGYRVRSTAFDLQTGLKIAIFEPLPIFDSHGTHVSGPTSPQPKKPLIVAISGTEKFKNSSESPPESSTKLTLAQKLKKKTRELRMDVYADMTVGKTQMESKILNDILQHLAPELANTDIMFAGHSLGGIVAYDAAYRLEKIAGEIFKAGSPRHKTSLVTVNSGHSLGATKGAQASLWDALGNKDLMAKRKIDTDALNRVQTSTYYLREQSQPSKGFWGMKYESMDSIGIILGYGKGGKVREITTQNPDMKWFRSHLMKNVIYAVNYEKGLESAKPVDPRSLKRQLAKLATSPLRGAAHVVGTPLGRVLSRKHFENHAQEATQLMVEARKIWMRDHVNNDLGTQDWLGAELSVIENERDPRFADLKDYVARSQVEIDRLRDEALRAPASFATAPINQSSPDLVSLAAKTSKSAKLGTAISRRSPSEFRRGGDYRSTPEITEKVEGLDSLQASELGYTNGGSHGGVTWRRWHGTGKLPFQGYKIHVSAGTENLAEVAKITLPILRKMGIHHKAIGSGEDLQRLEGTQVAKAIVAYPRTAKEAAHLAKVLDSALQGRKNPQIPGEVSVGTSKAVYVRYGAFLTDDGYRFNVDSAGQVLGKDGKLLLLDPSTGKLGFKKGRPLTFEELRYLGHRSGRGDISKFQIYKKLGIFVPDERGSGQLGPWPKSQDEFFREFSRAPASL